MNHVSLFSGIGGQSLACDWLGIETVGFCEIDGWNRRVLAKHWPQAGFHDDIKTLTGDVVLRWAGGRAPDLLTASWPCQPFSVAGKRLGRADERALWPEVARLVDETRPTNFLGENVPGIISLELDTVLADLESLGYACGAVVVPACAVNALHRRDRVWIMADTEARRVRRGRAPGHDGQPAQRGQEFPDAEHARPQGRGGQRELGEGGGFCDDRRTRYQPDKQAPRTVDAGPDGVSPGLVRRPATGPAEPDLIRQAWADGSWELNLPRVVAEEPERRQKLQAAGNAIVAVVAYEILRVMLGEDAA
jgi:DNA (cytosine-5)-methyltransferase 1